MANPEGALPARSRQKQVLCLGECRQWFTADHFICPECGWKRPGYNPSVRIAKLNAHTHAMAEYARKNH